MLPRRAFIGTGGGDGEQPMPIVRADDVRLIAVAVLGDDAPRADIAVVHSVPPGDFSDITASRRF